MKKYGLQLRIPKSQPSKPVAAARPPPASLFGGDDDEDVEKEISRQASKTLSLQKIEEQHKKALEEDPSAFDYDGVYDEMKEKIAKPKMQDRTERKSKYIGALLAKAKEREREHEIVYEKKLIKERSKEDHLYGDKERFVTSAYKNKLAEQAKWIEEERLRNIREEQDDVTKKDMTEFYFSLDKNVTFGAETSEPSKSKQKATQEATAIPATEDFETKEPSQPQPIKRPVSQPITSEEKEDLPSKAPLVEEEKNNEKKDSSEAQEMETKPNGEIYKRKEDALAAARERYLARKKSRRDI